MSCPRPRGVYDCAPFRVSAAGAKVSLKLCKVAKSPVNLVVQTHSSIAEIGAAAWDRLVGKNSPFLEYGFLRTLEETGCVDGRTGWHTALITAWEADELIGALPFYIKTHSRGEFVYDWGWADAAARARIDYYPKGVVAVPMTPVTGARLLVDPDAADPDAARRALVAGAIEVAKAADLSSVHFNFITEDEVRFFEEIDLPTRTQLQYHWRNHGYSEFDDFLGRFRSKRRANIRRERRKLAEQGVTTRVVRGDELTPAQMRRMFRYYVDTVTKYYWGQQYLTQDFFGEIARNLRERVHLVVAERDGQEFGGAFNLFKGERLYGRYWGALEEVEFAHFEVCQYRPIEWCIQNGIQVFEPGHGGEHKFERGFEPTKTYSAHWIKNPMFDQAIRSSLEHERVAVDARLRLLQQDVPLK